ncbi:MAG TPA: hypothetical protein VF556_10905 [Pyrinomonadaceae bacterium]
MRQKILLILSLLCIASTFSAVSAQTTDNNLKPSVITGDVTSLDAGKIVLQTKDGAVSVILSDKTEYKRVQPENPSLRNAVASSFSDIGVGDKLAVSGIISADKKTLPARSVFLMTKSDIAQKQTKESEQWRTRGIAGKVVGVNPQNNQITVEVRGLANTTSVVLTPKENAVFRRYAPNSVKYSEAKISSIAELKPGDMLRARGDKSADGAAFTAEEILSGAFQTVAGTVKSIDAEKGEVVISDFQTKKDITISVGSASTLKKFPEEMAQRMAQFQAAGGAGGIQPAGMGQNRPGGVQPPQPANPQGERPQGGGFGGMRGGQGGIDDMLERFPNITVADLKAGDMIAVSSSRTANADRITAIKLLAGVEPFLRVAQAAGANGGGQRGGQGGQGSFNIPGLDGADFP